MDTPKPVELKKSIREVWAVNEAMNQLLLQHIDDRAWRAEPPPGGRTLAAIFSHIHNDRLMWMTVWAKGRRRPPPTSRHKLTRKQAARALARSAAALAEVFAARLRGSSSPEAVACLGLMLVHDAHHRGQVMMLTRQLGYRLPKEAAYGIWQWGKLWKKLGIRRRWPLP